MRPSSLCELVLSPSLGKTLQLNHQCCGLGSRLEVDEAVKLGIDVTRPDSLTLGAINCSHGMSARKFASKYVHEYLLESPHSLSCRLTQLSLPSDQHALQLMGVAIVSQVLLNHHVTSISTCRGHHYDYVAGCPQLRRPYVLTTRR